MNRIVRALFAFGLVISLAPGQSVNAAEPSTKVDINKATVEELVKLPKIGPAVAQRMVEYRKQNGGFRKLEDVLLVRGIGQKTFDALKDRLTLGEGVKEASARSSESPSGPAGGGR